MHTGAWSWYGAPARMARCPPHDFVAIPACHKIPAGRGADFDQTREHRSRLALSPGSSAGINSKLSPQQIADEVGLTTRAIQARMTTLAQRSNTKERLIEPAAKPSTADVILPVVAPAWSNTRTRVVARAVSYGWGGRIRTSEWRDQNPLTTLMNQQVIDLIDSFVPSIPLRSPSAGMHQNLVCIVL
jgi:hypothetical protein